MFEQLGPGGCGKGGNMTPLKGREPRGRTHPRLIAPQRKLSFSSLLSSWIFHGAVTAMTSSYPDNNVSPSELKSRDRGRSLPGALPGCRATWLSRATCPEQALSGRFLPSHHINVLKIRKFVEQFRRSMFFHKYPWEGFLCRVTSAENYCLESLMNNTQGCIIHVPMFVRGQGQETEA